MKDGETFEDDGFGTGQPDTVESGQVPELLLGPCLHHLPVVASAVAIAETKLPRDVSVSVFERQNGRLEHLKQNFKLSLK